MTSAITTRRNPESYLKDFERIKAIGISKVFFRRLFTSKMGITPRQHILDIRIKRAKQLLAESGMTVSAISE